MKPMEAMSMRRREGRQMGLVALCGEKDLFRDCVLSTERVLEPFESFREILTTTDGLRSF